MAHVRHLELAHTGIGVGTVYASWIDTPLIANAESAMPSFARLRRIWARRAARPERLARRYHHPEACAVSVVDAIERRYRRVWCRTRSGWSRCTGWGSTRDPGALIQIWLLGRSSQQMDDEVRARTS